MSTQKPKTLLSFVWNTTGISAYRDEMHVDLRTSFERFEIHDGDVQESCFRVEEAAYELRIASEDRRFRRPKNPFQHAAARAKLEVATQALFGAVGDELTQLVVRKGKYGHTPELRREIAPILQQNGGVDGEGAVELDASGTVAVKLATSLAEPRLLLDLAYYFFHFEQTRDAILNSAALVDSLSDLANFDPKAPPPNDVINVLTTLKKWMAQPAAVDVPTIRVPVRTLCTALQLEYCARGVSDCW